MEDKTPIDAKQETTSSVPPVETPAASQGEPAAPPPAKTDTEPQSLEEALARELGPDKPPEEPPAPSKIPEAQPTEKAEEPKPGEKKEDVTPAAEPDKPPPFHEHPRWKEMVSERDELRAKVEKLEPAFQRFEALREYQQRNRIEDSQVKDALELLALYNSDPVKGVERLRETLTNLEMAAGLRISPDLEEEVEKGKLTEERALEIMKLRSEGKKKELTAQDAERERYNMGRAEMANAISTWEDTKRVSDPDYRPKAKETDADGFYETVLKFFTLATIQQPPRSGSEAVALAEKTYNDVKQMLGRYRAPAPIKRVPPTTSSSGNVPAEPETLEGVLESTIAELERERR